MSNSRETKIVSWNINSDRRVEIFDQPPYMYTANAFRELSVDNRFPGISSAIDYLFDKKEVRLFAFQEVEDLILPRMTEYLSSKGLAVLPMKYNPTKLAFN